jgi:hypothetical protein
VSAQLEANNPTPQVIALIGKAHYRCSRHSIRSDSLNAMARSILPVESNKRICQIAKTRQ